MPNRISRDDRATVEQEQCEAHQRRREETLMAVTEIDKDRGKGDSEEERQSPRVMPGRAVKLAQTA
jgi:hypothetical protein